MVAETTVSITSGDGTVMVPPMPLDEFKRRAARMSAEVELTRKVTAKKLAGNGETPMAERGNHEMFTDDETGAAASMTVAAGQLRAFIERIERLEEEKQTVSDDVKEVKAEAKGSGFDVRAINTLLKLRKKDQAERQEEEAILDLYKAALGMA